MFGDLNYSGAPMHNSRRAAAFSPHRCWVYGNKQGTHVTQQLESEFLHVRDSDKHQTRSTPGPEQLALRWDWGLP